MNPQIRKLAIAALVLVASLIVATTYWQTWASADLAARQDNSIQLVAQFRIKRGLVYSSDGRALAADRPRTIDGQTYWFRRYPARGLFAHLVGYSTQARARAGLERSENDYLTASNADLATVVRRTLSQLKGETVTGNTLILTVNAKAQKAALDGLAGACGAAVALAPATGKLLAMASTPGYDPNLMESQAGYEKILREQGPCSPASPLLNRATSGLYAPGSTFKVITTSAALDTGTYTPDSTFDDKGYCVEYGKKVSNFSDQNGPEVFGHVTLTQALQHSINAVYCKIGMKLGAKTMLDYARRFGFYSVPPLETPRDERVASGLYQNGRLFFPKHDYQVDPGRLAFGQERMLATPLQMAMVAAGIANGGVVMRPFSVARVVSPDGKTLVKTRPQVYSRAVKPKTAAEVTAMMEQVVRAGTGTAAQIPGVAVAGKTGTAETGVSNRNTAWFVAFAPAQRPEVAVAVVLENQAGVGGTTAAPIARAIMQAVLQPKANS